MNFETYVSAYVIKGINSISQNEFGGFGNVSFIEYVGFILMAFLATRVAFHFSYFGVLWGGVEASSQARAKPNLVVMLMGLGFSLICIFGVLPYYAYASTTPVWDEHIYYMWYSFKKILGA